MLSKFLTRFKRKQSETIHENVTCANCQTHFDGNFCPNCGQAVKDYDKPISFVFYNFMGDFFAFDTRFFRTFSALLFKPGFLSKEYIEGKRVRYAPPFRIYVFVSFILFLLLQIYTNRGLTTVLDSDITDGKHTIDSLWVAIADSIAAQEVVELDLNEFAKTDSLANKYDDDLDTTQGEENVDLKADLASFRDTRNLRLALNNLAAVLETKLEKEEDPVEKAKIRGHIRLCRSPEQAVAKILHYMSWAFFVLLPIFALLLKLVYIRRKQNYMRHLVFSIHIHAFIFVIMTLVVGFYMSSIEKVTPFTTVLVLIVPVYIVIAMKRFYEQAIGKTIAKFFAVSFIYYIIFLIVLIGAALNALNLF